MSEKTVEYVEGLVTQIAEARAAYEAAKEVSSEKWKELQALENKAMECLEELELDDYRGKRATISIQEVRRVSNPKDADKDKFFAWLKEIGEFDRLATVHNTSLNTFFKERWEEAKATGCGEEFHIPGIEFPIPTKKLKYTKRKEK